MRSMLTKRDSFINGSLVPKGFPVLVRDGLKAGTNLTELTEANAPGGAVAVAVLGPTGPNPRFPQQIPPDAVQTLAGHVLPGGTTLVSEVTARADERFAEINAAGGPSLKSLMDEGGDDEGSGSVRAIIADLGGKTDEELNKLKADEEKGAARVTLTRAIDAELRKRART